MFTVMLCVVILKVRLYIPVESWILLTSLLPFLSLSPSLPPIPHSLTYSLFLLSFTYSLPLPSFPFPLSPSSPFFLSLTHSLSSFPFPLSPPPPFLFHSLTPSSSSHSLTPSLSLPSLSLSLLPLPSFFTHSLPLFLPFPSLSSPSLPLSLTPLSLPLSSFACPW